MLLQKLSDKEICNLMQSQSHQLLVSQPRIGARTECTLDSTYNHSYIDSCCTIVLVTLDVGSLIRFKQAGQHGT